MLSTAGSVPQHTSLVDDIKEKFEAMSRERDAPSNVRSAGTLRAVEGGYVHEILSTSSPRPRYSQGDHVETVTKRTVRTVSGLSNEETNISLNFSNEGPSTDLGQPRSSTRSPQQSSTTVLPQSSPSSSVVNGNAYQGESRPPSIYVPLPHSGGPETIDAFGRWRRVPSRTRSPSQPAKVSSPTLTTETRTTTALHLNPTSGGRLSRGRSTQPKQLGFGATETRIVEPSRMSPLRVEHEYAPVRYISRDELERLRSRRATQADALPRIVRRSSIPRLDDLAAGNPYRTEPFENRGEEWAFYNQPPVPSDPFLDDGPSPPPRLVPQHTVRSHYADDAPSTPRSSASRSSSRASSRASSGRPILTTAMLPPSTVSLEKFTEYLCLARSIPRAPPPPAYAAEAFRLLNIGTFLIKYGRRGVPHERWLTVRLMRDDRGSAVQPYLAWALHEKSTTIKDRLNLVHLSEVSTGAMSASFQRHMLGPNAIRGPMLGDQYTTLATDYAMSFVFRSQTHYRTVDLLATDDQTFRCWLLVMNYFVEVNSSATGSPPVDVDTLPPESMRSSSAPSRRSQ